MICVAIDDEPIALSIIGEYCRLYGDIELHSFTSPVMGMECISRIKPDVVFLDIEMNSHNGLDLARQLPQDVCLIFTTAYADYALEGFNVNAVDFLHKPVFYPRFEQAMAKVRRYKEGASSAALDDVLTLKVEHKTVVVRIADILYIEAMGNYVKIYRKGLPMVLTQMPMKEIESRLPADRFVRLHRSYIVSSADIEKYTNRQVYLSGVSAPVPVGRRYADSYNAMRELFRN